MCVFLGELKLSEEGPNKKEKQAKPHHQKDASRDFFPSFQGNRKKIVAKQKSVSKHSSSLHFSQALQSSRELSASLICERSEQIEPKCLPDTCMQNQIRLFMQFSTSVICDIMSSFFKQVGSPLRYFQCTKPKGLWARMQLSYITLGKGLLPSFVFWFPFLGSFLCFRARATVPKQTSICETMMSQCVKTSLKNHHFATFQISLFFILLQSRQLASLAKMRLFLWEF